MGLGQVYREAMRQMAAMSNLEVWYSRVVIEGMTTAGVPGGRLRLQGPGAHGHDGDQGRWTKAHTKDSMKALDKLTYVVDGQRRIISDPPLLVPVEEVFPEVEAEQPWAVPRSSRRYRQTCSTDRRHLLGQYRFSQMARKVVGVGSVGTRVWVILMHGPRHEDVLFLQAKEAEASVLERFTKKSQYANHGARVVAGQRLMQASSDIFLGWQRTEGIDGVVHDYYIRQLQDWKGSVDTDNAVPQGLEALRRSCAPTRWPGPTPARGTASPWPRISATTPRSRRPWPASPSPTPTRTSGTTRRSPPPAGAAGCTPRRGL